MMKAIHLLNDVDGVWAKPVKVAEEGGVQVVTEKNVAAANLATAKQAKLLVALRELVQHKLKMQTIASKSVLGWKLVHRWILHFSRRNCISWEGIVFLLQDGGRS